MLLFTQDAAGFNSDEVRVFDLCPAFDWVTFLGSVSPWELPVSTSVNP